MKIRWLGHASFLITSGVGTRIITDPYTPGNNLNYGEIKESADIVVTSHDHFDHSNVTAVKGNPEVVKEPGLVEAKGIKFCGIPAYHDVTAGSERGHNILFCFEVDGIRICHLGDLGHQLSDKEVAELGKVDILLIPVGGFYTIDALAATEVSGKIAPKVIVPMHYKNDKCDFPIAGVDDFLEGKTGVTRKNTSEVEFKPGELPATTQIIVLKPTL